MAECGTCTLCCTMLPVNWLNKPINTDCKHCKDGCLIHEEKPSECSDYNCMYAQVTRIPVALRPDNCGIIFEKLNSKIIYGVLNPKSKPTEMARKQIRGFLMQGFSVILASIDQKENKYFINPNHKEKHIRRDFVKQLNKRYGYIWN